MTRPIRWGVLGTGNIASVFTEDLLTLPGHEVAAVGSRAPETAETFANRYGIPRAHGSYEDLAGDDGVDVVYITTPHHLHHPMGLLCLEAGRAVLVEKPFTVSAMEARELAGLARTRGLFTMEAMWMRFNPIVERIRTLVADGAIGEVRAVYADFGIAPEYDPAGRLWAPELAGGALLDLGVYPVALACLLLGAPERVRALSTPAATGVDADTAILLGFPSGAVALLHASLLAHSPHAATIVGTRGRIIVDGPFVRPDSTRLFRDGAPPETWREELAGHGYTYQAEEVARCLRAGRTESDRWPLDLTVTVMETLDAIRAAGS
ncbi:Gfo/Idh/MocA family protein [Acrocarpospora catenulata]|uniref:Gfo/Idh/MocA family protein n=1 Tax=Acrocarpospora catenulata TaxID=2836182 RepID=UPI001BD96C1C|nr:Gfo/Idh/MocA family oxidoreductase [Acrocarpospora catenulata]